MTQKYTTVDAYIHSLSPEIKKKIDILRSVIQKVVPQAKEKLSYGVPAFYLNGNLVLYAGFKNHIGLYPQPSAMKKFKKKLASYETSEGTIRFPLNKPLPLDLIREIVSFRVQENMKKV